MRALRGSIRFGDNPHGDLSDVELDEHVPVDADSTCTHCGEALEVSGHGSVVWVRVNATDSVAVRLWAHVAAVGGGGGVVRVGDQAVEVRKEHVDTWISFAIGEEAQLAMDGGGWVELKELYARATVRQCVVSNTRESVAVSGTLDEVAAALAGPFEYAPPQGADTLEACVDGACATIEVAVQWSATSNSAAMQGTDGGEAAARGATAAGSGTTVTLVGVGALFIVFWRRRREDRAAAALADAAVGLVVPAPVEAGV